MRIDNVISICVWFVLFFSLWRYKVVLLPIWEILNHQMFSPQVYIGDVIHSTAFQTCFFCSFSWWMSYTAAHTSVQKKPQNHTSCISGQKHLITLLGLVYLLIKCGICKKRPPVEFIHFWPFSLVKKNNTFLYCVFIVILHILGVGRRLQVSNPETSYLQH